MTPSKYDMIVQLNTRLAFDHKDMEPQDIMRGYIIEALLSKGEFNIDEVNAKYHVEIRRMMMREFKLLSEMQADGVVEVADPVVRITPACKPYTAVVCKVFDRYERPENFPEGFFG